MKSGLPPGPKKYGFPGKKNPVFVGVRGIFRLIGKDKEIEAIRKGSNNT